MKKNRKNKIRKIFALVALLALLLPTSMPIFSAETEPVPGCEGGNEFNSITGEECWKERTGGGSSGGGGVITSNPSIKSKLFVESGEATDITQTSATLRGTGGDLIANPTLPITAYFRYSTLPITPIFCNDIYGARMISTGDISLGVTRTSSFFQNVTGLSPNTTYYYCAIVSNRENIAYGGSEVVKEFHTNCLETTAGTKAATNVRSDSARLNGDYCSTRDVTTAFEYREAPSENLVEGSPWTRVGGVSRSIGSNSNLYGNINFELRGLKADTLYEFYTVAQTVTETVEGPTRSFSTRALGTGSSGATCPAGWSGLHPNCMAPRATCTSGEVYVAETNTCVDPTSCPTGQEYQPSTNSCVVPVACTPPEIRNPSSNTCVTPPSNQFCSDNPTDPWCLPGPGWDWNGNNWTGGNWNGGTWNGGGWVNGVWSGGTWSGNGGTWSGGSWSNGNWTGGSWSSGGGTSGGIIDTPQLFLGQVIAPPWDAIVRYHEGVETVFARQIVADKEFAKMYGYVEGTDLWTFAWDLAHVFAKMFGYVDPSGREIRVSFPDIAAYQLQLIGNKLTVYEYFDGIIVDVRNMTTSIKDASGYEYYFKK